jgi:hypothetical protein
LLLGRVNLRKSVALFTLLLVMLLSACEKPGTGDEPAIPETAPLPESVPALPASGRQDEKARPVVEMRKPDSLNLRIRDSPETVQMPPAFGSVPDSGWLDPGPGVTGTATGESVLLPDLFAEQQRDKPVSVKGKMRFGDDAQDLSDTLDGAEMSIEIQTD